MAPPNTKHYINFTSLITPKTRMISRGFTLLEILITIAIFAAIISILYPSYTGTFRNIKAAESQTEIYQMARITLERMTEDLESAYLPKPANGFNIGEGTLKSAGFFGEDSSIDGRSADRLRFISGKHLLLDEDDRAGSGKIVYYVKENQGEDGFILYRSDTLELGNQPEEETGGWILCESLNSINFTYHDDDGESHDSWDSASESTKERLPLMVSIGLEFSNRSDPESPLRFMTAVTLPMARREYGKGS
ncbi:prepilin-type N-terminal cleavage/methylation domain-containing protein [Thermodesulfobacteriota bacterium]